VKKWLTQENACNKNNKDGSGEQNHTRVSHAQILKSVNLENSGYKFEMGIIQENNHSEKLKS